MKYSLSGSQGEERGGSKAIFFSTMNRKVKQAKKWGTMINSFLVIKGTAPRIFGIRST